MGTVSDFKKIEREVVAKNPWIQFAGPVEYMKEFKKHDIPSERCHLLEEGKSLGIKNVTINGVFADNGEFAPDALGIVLDFDGIKVYQTGDTAYRPDEFIPTIEMRQDLLIPCINGRFGNMDATKWLGNATCGDERCVNRVAFGLRSARGPVSRADDPSQLWAFRGPEAAVRSVARHLFRRSHERLKEK
jgi:hypothetical protein